MPHRTAFLVALAALILIFGLVGQAVFNLPYRVRFANPAANYLAVAALSVLAPFLLLFVGRSIRKAWLRRSALVAVGFIAIPCLVISSCAVLDAPALSEPDLSYELLSEAQAGNVAYRLYRTNCGATCAFGLDLREERDLPFGVRLVSPKWSLYRASEGTVKVDPSSVIVVDGEVILAKVAR